MDRRTAIPGTARRQPHSVTHDSFTLPDAREIYDPAQAPDITAYADSYMPDDVTRDYARRMHYSAYRWKKAKGLLEGDKWKAHYDTLRDQIVLGNRKLIYRAVRRRMGPQVGTEDLVADCQIVLIQAVAAYNPWLGIRFSTYAFTCLVRALSRISQRLANDWLSKSASLDLFPEGEPDRPRNDEPTSVHEFSIDEYLNSDHPLLSEREKAIIHRRFRSGNDEKLLTLEMVGKEMGLSKERVRQVQASAIGKLRNAMLQSDESPA